METTERARRVPPDRTRRESAKHWSSIRRSCVQHQALEVSGVRALLGHQSQPAFDMEGKKKTEPRPSSERSSARHKNPIEKAKDHLVMDMQYGLRVLKVHMGMLGVEGSVKIIGKVGDYETWAGFNFKAAEGVIDSLELEVSRIVDEAVQHGCCHIQQLVTASAKLKDDLQQRLSMFSSMTDLALFLGTNIPVTIPTPWGSIGFVLEAEVNLSQKDQTISIHV
ncbi:hypothetical protein CYMTET_48382 [Cymbomonas tetramitiformis]|uniref:Uncharacterized protein n=1 Tax=Cymbomonas tetramitiformis TaxID=36881 RepID=A0AAE0BTM0_9CHLO|nr:hypothetical protein CYMTET_48382 [Cymbomonas tetramitiformis]